MLQRTLNDERTARKVVETNYLQAQSNTSRTNRYLDSILKVNQELVATRTAGASPPPPSQARRSASACGPEKPRRLRRKKSTREKCVPGQRTGAAPEGVDVGAAVAEAFRVGRAGGDPVLSLQALYERIGFCALQEKHGDAGTLSLPTSPSRATGGEGRKENGFHGEEEEEGFQEEADFHPSTKRAGSAGAVNSGLCSRNNVEAMGSPVPHVRRGDRGMSESRGGGWDLGRGKGSSTAAHGYSFARSPRARPASAAERSPKTAIRLEALASQLEREKADVEQWYRTVVNRVSAESRFSRFVYTSLHTNNLTVPIPDITTRPLGRTTPLTRGKKHAPLNYAQLAAPLSPDLQAYPGAQGGGTDVNLDAKCLTRAISCLQVSWFLSSMVHIPTLDVNIRFDWSSY